MLYPRKTSLYLKSIQSLCIVMAIVFIQGTRTHLFSQAPDSLAGMKGFFLSVGSNYNLAFKYWMSPKTALVAGVNIFANGFGSSQSAQTQASSTLNTGLFGRFQYFLTERNRFMPYLTAGGSVSNTFSWTQPTNSNGLSLGVNGGVGMECFILPWLSVAGELTLGGTYSLTQRESPITGGTPFFWNSWSAGFGNSGIIITIYF